MIGIYKLGYEVLGNYVINIKTAQLCTYNTQTNL